MTEAEVNWLIDNKLKGLLEPEIFFEEVIEEHRQHPGVVIRLPETGSTEAVAYDVFTPVDFVIPAGGKIKVYTDVKIKFPSDFALLMNVRSSFGEKRSIILAYAQGWVESDYHGNESNDGNLGVTLYNYGDKDIYISKDDPATNRIAQVMFIRKYKAKNGNIERPRKGGTGSSDNQF